jgi:hypothetical protein
MARTRVSIDELLLRHRAIDEDQLRNARERQEKTGGDLGHILVELGYVSEDLLLRAQANQLGIPYVNLQKEPPPYELAVVLTEALCRRFGVIPVSGSIENKLVRVATSTPTDLERIAMLAHASGFRVEAAAATAKSIERAIEQVFAAPTPPPSAAGEPLPPEIQPEPEPAEDLGARVARLETLLEGGQFAALLARIERLEQVAERDHRMLNVIGQVLLELGFITREELLKRLGRD